MVALVAKQLAVLKTRMSLLVSHASAPMRPPVVSSAHFDRLFSLLENVAVRVVGK